LGRAANGDSSGRDMGQRQYLSRRMAEVMKRPKPLHEALNSGSIQHTMTQEANDERSNAAWRFSSKIGGEGF